MSLEQLNAEVRACTLCEKFLPLGPRPILQIGEHARILIAGQAPGKRTHLSGQPFDDPSGERLRDWMGLDKATFYDASKVAILPMGFCFPGSGKSGDLPPRPECAEKWRAKLLRELRAIKFTLIIGQYALAQHLPDKKGSVTDIVKSWQTHLPAAIPLPHPSPRNNIWLKKNSWFESELLPELKHRVAAVLR